MLLMSNTSKCLWPYLLARLQLNTSIFRKGHNKCPPSCPLHIAFLAALRLTVLDTNKTMAVRSWSCLHGGGFRLCNSRISSGIWHWRHTRLPISASYSAENLRCLELEEAAAADAAAAQVLHCGSCRTCKFSSHLSKWEYQIEFTLFL